MNDLLRRFADHPWFWGIVWQATLAIGCVWLAAICLVRQPVWRTWLWRVALCKCAVAWIVPFSLAIPLWRSPPVGETPVTVSEADFGRLLAERPADPSVESIGFDPSHRAARTTPWRSLSAAEILCGFWLGGVAVLAAVWIFQWFQLRRLLRIAAPIDTSFSRLIGEVRRQVGISRNVGVVVTERAVSPLVTGWLRPRILLPNWLTDAAHEQELRTALAHEFAHIRRRDLFWSLFAGGVGLVYFFHPLVWLASRRLRSAQESAADELVLKTTAITPTDYAQVLVRVAASARATPPLHPALLTASRSYRNLSNRIASLQAPRGFSRVSLAVVTFVALLGLVPWHPVLSDPQPAAKPQVKADEPKTETLTPERILEIDSAVNRLRGKGVYIREFWPRGDSRYFVQISGKEGGKDFSLQDVETIARGVTLSLNLPGARYTPADMKPLSTVKRFLNVELSGDSVTDELLAVLPKLAVERLDLGTGAYTVAGMKHVAACKAITSISFKGTTVTDDFLEPLVDMPNLEEVGLQSPNFTAKAFEIQSRLRGLKSLRMPFNPDPNTPVLQPGDIARLTKLQRIGLFGGKYGDDMARALADHCPDLEEVQLERTTITSRGVKDLARLKHVKFLDLNGAKLDDDIADSIRQMKKLEWLSLNQCGVGDKTLAATAECPDISSLDVAYGTVTDAGVQHVLKLPKLSALTLSMNKRVTDESLDVLKRLPNDEKHHFMLQIQFTSISEDGSRELQAALKHATVITSFPKE